VPVVVFTGPRGSGKTALLDKLETHLKQNVPHARINCRSLDPAVASWDILSFLVFEFNRLAANYRKVPFPRFMTARLVIDAELTLNDLATAQQQVKDTLLRYNKIDQLRGFVAGMAEVSAATVTGIGVPLEAKETTRQAIGQVLNGLVSWHRGRKVMRGEGLTWYGTGQAGINQLIDINRLARSADERDKRKATELTWAAFLADLHAAFRTGRASRDWSLNTVVLLDDIDSKPGGILLKELTQARRQRAVHQPDEPDPLTVVATSSKISTAEEGSDWYHPVGLRDLMFDEVVAMVSSVAGAWAGTKQVAASVYRFTRGHPGSTAMLIDAFVTNGGRPVPLKSLLQARLDDPVGEAQAGSVEEQMLHALVGDTSGPSIENLVTCSAARDFEQAEQLSGSGLIPPVRGDSGVVVPSNVQVSDVAGGRVRMLPVLRHLLLRHLSRDNRRWSATHQWLQHNGEPADQLYHALAGRDLALVTERLVARLVRTDIDDWLSELYSITSAPNDLDCDEADPDKVLAKVGRAEPPDAVTAAVGRLVVTLWIAQDPWSDADRSDLFGTAAAELRLLRQHVQVGRARLLKEADRFVAMAEDPNTAGVSVGGTASTAAGAGESPKQTTVEPSTFVPPTTEAGRKRKLWRKMSIGTGVAAGLAAALVAGFVVVPALFPECGDGLAEHSGECVGITDGSYVFDDRLAAVAEKIRAENERVGPESHVTLALLTPMTPSSTGSSTSERIRAQLQGAHAAQVRANEGENWPKVKLMLANPGSDQQEWRRVTDQLVELADRPEHLVGVIGLVPSSQRTQEVMRELAAADLPMVATLVTATDINKVGGSHYVEGFTRVSSTTHDQVTALSNYLSTAPRRRAMLVYDRDEQNLFVSAMRDDFKAIAPTRANLPITVESEYDTEASLNAQLKAIMGDLCGDGAPDTILYAARAELFDELIVNVRERNCARDRMITIVSGSDASVLRTQGDLKPKANENNAKTAILYTPAADPEALRQDGVEEAEQLSTQFERLSFDATDLADGWAILTFDGMLAATNAVGRAAAARGGGELPTRQEVRFELERTDRERNQVRGAGGTFTLDAETGNVIGRRLPVIEVDQSWRFTIKGIYDVGPPR
jgi:ABC-type branched-subunit amino acid transport system substrate-binding protein